MAYALLIVIPVILLAGAVLDAPTKHALITGLAHGAAGAQAYAVGTFHHIAGTYAAINTQALIIHGIRALMRIFISSTRGQ